ncbi:glycosyltransferase [Aeromicrobium yanjiei]|uniref:Glycosyltransferase n=1 Tax=Aeromicrobium yanjiei TaxID=2662028 RepID=A0A5Q2MK62_9ACTN|nr:glycosyltransferase [Aeromicrobium yanjiei]
MLLLLRSRSKPTTEPRTRRQWGAERRSEPLSIVHPVPSGAKITWGRVGIVVTILSWIGYVVSTIVREFIDYGGNFRFTMEAFSYLVVVTFLTFSALMYLVARQGALLRFRDHVRAPRGMIDRHFADTTSERLTVLIPSYAEEPDVVRLTLWSAALQEYPDLHLVLLIDDPPAPTDPEVRAKLEATRRLASDIMESLAAPRERFQASLELATAELASGPVRRRSVKVLLKEYRAAAAWLEEMASAEDVVDHVSEFFVDQVLMGLANELSLTALALEAALEQGGLPDSGRVLELHRRLAWIFRADLTSFERKAYGSLSHEANKAMNVNAYLGLMGHVWRPNETAAGIMLDEVETPRPGDIVIPDSGYVLTLDADSQLLRDYCIRLVYYLEQTENQHVAIIQTPYSSFRGAPTRIERIAGASTDLQHILHQGKTHHNATFWVGANAVIRKRALEDIVEVENVAGYDIKTYIQDRTVIEDTESSIDIGSAGWALVNYPERLSYSATPPDFGSLVVQRRRWANGGLLILPKLWEQVRHRRHSRTRVHLVELALRVNYMASIAWASFGLLFLLFYPYDSRLLSPLIVGAALPYFIAMGSDLRACGHRFTDIFRIYGFNLVLLPVNLAGVLKSIQQAFTGEKIPFARTPKVRDRTAAPGLHVLVPYLIVLFSLLTAWRDFHQENWGNFGFAMFNAILASAAISAYIGVRASFVDMGLGVLNWLFVEPKPKAPAKQVATDDDTIDWAAILYYGDRRLARDLRRRGDRRRRLRRSEG